jgi:hypothetical protein
MHTRGLIACPWRKDLQLGAAHSGNGLAIVIKAPNDWAGALDFDIPRHRYYMGFRRDWPRMNTLPEWFTVDYEQRYQVQCLDTDTANIYSGKELHNGLPVQLKANQTLRIQVSPLDRK